MKMKKMKKLGVALGIFISFILLAAIVGCSQDNHSLTNEQNGAASPPKTSEEAKADWLSYNPPSLEDVPEGPEGEAILYGYDLVNESHIYLEDYVGNQLSCTSCHAGAGLEQHVSSFVGVTTAYPQYRPREGIVFTLEDRINGCMLRSMNGKEIPRDSTEMRAMVAYLTFISEGIPVGADIPWRDLNNMKDVPVPNIDHGRELYAQSCQACHAADGSGIGANTGPALWGENSFNDGSGMARISKMTAYIQRNMPIGKENTLTDQEAADIAAYVLSFDRPLWSGKENDWPHGGRPKDIIDQEKRDQIREGTLDWEEVLGKK